MRRYHKAILVVVLCSIVLAVGLIRAFVLAPRSLTSAEVLVAARGGVGAAVDFAVERGGLDDAEALVRAAIASELHRQGFGGMDVRLRRPNDFNPWAAFYFFVEVEDLSVRFDLEGTRDPLLAIRLGRDVLIRQDPFRPYETHREPSVLAACVARPYYHLAADGPDFFARLENRTRDPYHFGFETLLTNGLEFAVDHAFLETGGWGLDELHRRRYGL